MKTCLKKITTHTNCVISAVGKNSLHRKWMEGNMNFDLHLIVYDDSSELFRQDTEHICHIKGYKLKVIYKYLQEHPNLLEQYDYFFLPDDDILMNADTINSLFDAMRHYRLKIAQPALTLSYYTWAHTLKDRYCKLRYTDFIEMMVPCFEREALEKVLFTFNENETGWGTEAHWPLLIQATPQDMAVIDEVSVIHTRPIQSGQEIHKRELEEYLQKHNLTLAVKQYDSILTDTEFCCDRNTCLMLKYTLAHWMASEKISNASVGMGGYFGYVYILFLFSEMTQDRNYADVVYRLLEHAQEGLGLIKNDMTFARGITGCCWLIEYLAQQGFIKDDSQEILEETDQYIRHYVEQHRETLSLAELTGVGRYYHLRQITRPTELHKQEAEDVTVLLAEKVHETEGEIEVDIQIDILILLQEYKRIGNKDIRKLEKVIDRMDSTQVERAYRRFRIYLLTKDAGQLIRVQENMKNLKPQLLTFEDVWMLAEIMYYTIN